MTSAFRTVTVVSLPLVAGVVRRAELTNIRRGIHGTYLAANVIYAVIYGEDPADLAYLPAAVTEEGASFLRRVAWETVNEYDLE